MAKYLFVYHGGKNPETEEEVAEVLDAWGNWFGTMGAAVVDGGNPVGQSYTINGDGSVTDNGGPNPASGYSLVEASDLDDAIAKARGCPILNANGTVELAEVTFNALIKLRLAQLHLRGREVLVAVIDCLELTAVNRHDRLREQLQTPADNNELPAVLAAE